MKYPPLNALRAFVVAGQYQSFLLAAKELHVSAASISRFIKLLENDLGLALFTRHPNGVELTEEGKNYLHAIQPALHTLATTSDAFRQHSAKRRLTIIAIPAIAETWLVSRLWQFQQLHDDIQINLELNDRPVKLHPNDEIVWLTHADQPSGNGQYFAMPKDQLTLICTPDIAKTMKQPRDALTHPQLVDIDWTSDWPLWLHQAGITHTTLPHPISFERYSMVINAALAGSGVAIGHTVLVKSYLDMGTLVAPFDVSTTPNKQFYAVIAPNTQQRSVKQFIDWFIE